VYGSVDSNTVAITVNPPLAPEINVKVDTTDIPDEGSYDFGSQDVGTDTDVTFTIENTGTVDLTLSDSPIINITGTDADQFSEQQHPAYQVASGESTTFIIRFSPTSEGSKTASISIANNDADENPYDITLNGTGTQLGGTGIFIDSGQSLGDASSKDVVLGDFDGDGDLDVFVANYGANKVWLNDGSGTFTDSGQNLGTSDSYCVALGDVDGDGDLDAFVANGGLNRLWLNDGSGTFYDSAQNLGTL
jgi:hypothetical protein